MKYLRKYILLATCVVLFIGMSSATCVRGLDCGGLSHGYYKNHESAWVGYDPGDKIIDVFPSAQPFVSNTDTLRMALRYKGGNGVDGAERILLRQAVAAILNNADPGIPYYYGYWGTEGPGDDITLPYIIPPDFTREKNEANIKAIVNTVISRQDRDEMLFWASVFDHYNNIGV